MLSLTLLQLLLLVYLLCGSFFFFLSSLTCSGTNEDRKEICQNINGWWTLFLGEIFPQYDRSHSALPKARVLSPVTARESRSFIFGLPPLPSPYPHAPQTRLLGAKYMFVDGNCWIGNQQQGLQKNFLRLRKSGCTEHAWTGNETFPRIEHSLNCPKC